MEADRRAVSEMSRKALLGKLMSRAAGAQLAQYRYFAACQDGTDGWGISWGNFEEIHRVILGKKVGINVCG